MNEFAFPNERLRGQAGIIVLGEVIRQKKRQLQNMQKKRQQILRITVGVKHNLRSEIFQNETTNPNGLPG